MIGKGVTQFQTCMSLVLKVNGVTCVFCVCIDINCCLLSAIYKNELNMLKHPLNIFSSIISHNTAQVISVHIYKSCGFTYSQILSFLQELQVTGIPGILFYFLALIWAIFSFVWLQSSMAQSASLPIPKSGVVPKRCERCLLGFSFCNSACFNGRRWILHPLLLWRPAQKCWLGPLVKWQQQRMSHLADLGK